VWDKSPNRRLYNTVNREKLQEPKITCRAMNIPIPATPLALAVSMVAGFRIPACKRSSPFKAHGAK
jgi:hypothetical protein